MKIDTKVLANVKQVLRPILLNSSFGVYRIKCCQLEEAGISQLCSSVCSGMTSMQVHYSMLFTGEMDHHGKRVLVKCANGFLGAFQDVKKRKQSFSSRRYLRHVQAQLPD